MLNLNVFISSVNRLNIEKKNIDKALIKIYSEQNNIDISSSVFLVNYLNDIESGTYERINEEISKYCVRLDINNLIEIFELVISADEKRENGMVYTPILLLETY